MTFSNFLQILAFNLLSNTIPLCILLYTTAYLVIRMYEKRFGKYITKSINSWETNKIRDSSQQDKFGTR